MMNFYPNVSEPNAEQITTGYILWFPLLQKNTSIVNKWQDAGNFDTSLSHEIFDDSEECTHGAINCYSLSKIKDVLHDIINECDIQIIHTSFPVEARTKDLLDHLVENYTSKCTFHLYGEFKLDEDYYTGELSEESVDLFEVHPYKKLMKM